MNRVLIDGSRDAPCAWEQANAAVLGRDGLGEGRGDPRGVGESEAVPGKEADRVAVRGDGVRRGDEAGNVVGQNGRVWDQILHEAVFVTARFSPENVTIVKFESGPLNTQLVTRKGTESFATSVKTMSIVLPMKMQLSTRKPYPRAQSTPSVPMAL
jgi:hypothetical protein